MENVGHQHATCLDVDQGYPVVPHEDITSAVIYDTSPSAKAHCAAALSGLSGHALQALLEEQLEEFWSQGGCHDHMTPPPLVSPLPPLDPASTPLSPLPSPLSTSMWTSAPTLMVSLL